MKKYFLITVIFLTTASSYSFAQVDSSGMMKSQKQVDRQQRRVDKQEKRVKRMDRKQNKQQNKLERRNKKLERRNRKNDKNMRQMEKDQKKMEQSKSDSSNGALLYDRRTLIFQNSLVEIA